MRLTNVVATVLVVLAGASVTGQSLPIGIIDFYGLRTISEAQARSALSVKEGDSVEFSSDAPPTFLAESKRNLSALPGVRDAHVTLVCCDGGRVILYVGIEETGAFVPQFRKAPLGDVRLPAAVVQTGRNLLEAISAAVQRGDGAEDDSNGYTLTHDPAARAIQEGFIETAKNVAPLRNVLRNSSDGQQRALAALILGYASNQAAVVEDLEYGMSDPSADVRNNATRTLAVMAGASPELVKHIPLAPFIDLMQSPEWSDRNKASLALVALTKSRDPGLLATLKNRAIVPLVEMARWKSLGHALPALMILGRIAGQSDEVVQAALDRGDHEAVIDGAINRP